MHGAVAVTARRQHARAATATVDAACLASFFRALDGRHQSRVSLADLAAFTAAHNISFEEEKGQGEAGAGAAGSGAGSRMPLPMETQHARVLERMFREAASLRQPQLYAKAPARGAAAADAAQSREPALELEDVATVLALRPALAQSARGSQVSVSARSAYRSQWLQLLMCVEPEPFEPVQYDVHAGPGYLSQRAGAGDANHAPPLPRSMYEREESRTIEQRSARSERRKAAVGEGPFNPTVTLNAPPTARSSAESYGFTQSTTRRTPLSPRYLAARAARDAALQAQQEKEWNPRQRKLKQLARALDANAHSFQLQSDEADEQEDTDGTTTGPAPPRTSGGGGASAPVHVPEALDASRLTRITFRLRDEYQARVDAAQLKSDALDFRDDAQDHMVGSTGDADGDDEEEQLAARLLASMVGAGAGAEAAPLKPQGTARERVAKALAAQGRSLATSARFKATGTGRPGSASSATGDGAPLMRLPDGSVRPRWINANAPEGSSGGSGTTRRSRSAASDPVAAAAAVEYDDQGRPILPVFRHALGARMMEARPGMLGPRPERKGADAAQALLLAERTARFLEALPVPDPIDALLAPFVPESPPPDTLGALRRALDSTPFVAATARGTHRDEVNEAAAAAAAAPSATQSLAAAAAVSTLLSARSEGGASPSSSSRPAFLLDFHLPSPQDERRIASQTLSCFGTGGPGSEKPTIANGGITRLEQLKPGYTPPSGTAASAQVIDRDASVGDLSLLPRGSAQLAMVLARQKLDAARPPFRLDFLRGGPLATGVVESDVITRDGGATTAAESEAWRMHQLGFSGRAGAALAAQTARPSRARAGNGAAPPAPSASGGAHTSRHPAPFTTLGASLAPPPPPLHVSEREAVMRERGLEKVLRAEKEAERRVSERARLRPSERKRIELHNKQLERFQQFPFTRLPIPEEAKAQLA